MDNNKVAAEGGSDRELEKIIDYIRQNKGVDLTTYRQSFVLRRLRMRMLFTKAQSYRDYIDIIKNVPDEFNNLLDNLGINVTEFFRDPEVFAACRKKVLADLISRKEAGNNRVINIWSAACATGEEPYSIAMTVKEALAGSHGFTARIIASDMDTAALGKAQEAKYKPNDFRKLDKKILENYFTPVYNGLYQLKDEIKQLVKFQKHNLITEQPVTRMDVIFCRNMMIYLNRQQQESLIRKFHQSLNSKGYLILGKVENVWIKDLFDTVDMREKIYQKLPEESVLKNN